MHSPRSSSSISEIDSLSDSGLSELEDPLSGSWLDIDSLKDFTDSGSSEHSHQSDDGVIEDEDRTPFVDVTKQPPLFGHPPSTLGSSYFDPDGSATVASLNSSMGTISSSAYRLTPQPRDQGLILPDPMSDSYRSTTTEPEASSKAAPAPASTRLYSFLADSTDAAGTHSAVDQSWLRAVGMDAELDAESADVEASVSSSRADGEYSLLNSTTSEDLDETLKASAEFFEGPEKTNLAPEQAGEAAALQPRVLGRSLAKKWALRTALIVLASFLSLTTLCSLSSSSSPTAKTTLDKFLEPIQASQTQSVFSTIWEQASSSAPPADPTHPPSDLQLVKNALSTFYSGMIKAEAALTSSQAPTDASIKTKAPMWQRLRTSTDRQVAKSHALQSYVDARSKKEAGKQWVFESARFQARGKPRVRKTGVDAKALIDREESASFTRFREDIKFHFRRTRDTGVRLAHQVWHFLWQTYGQTKEEFARFILAFRKVSQFTYRRASDGATVALSRIEEGGRFAQLRGVTRTHFKRASRAGLVLTKRAQHMLRTTSAQARRDGQRVAGAGQHSAIWALRRAAHGASVLARKMPTMPSIPVETPLLSPEEALQEAYKGILQARASLDTLAAQVDTTSRRARKGLDKVLHDAAIKGKVVRSRTSRVLEMVHHAALQAVL